MTTHPILGQLAPVESLGRATLEAINASGGCSISAELAGINARGLEIAAEPELWCLHILGPDDVYAAPSKAAAVSCAARFNARFGPIAAQNDVMCEAVVVPWPYSPESHAESLPSWSQWRWPDAEQLKPSKDSP